MTEFAAHAQGEELSDEEADALVGTVDDTDPIEVVAGDESELAPVPDEWDASAHDEELRADEAVDTTPVELEGDQDDEET